LKTLLFWVENILDINVNDMVSSKYD